MSDQIRPVPENNKLVEKPDTTKNDDAGKLNLLDLVGVAAGAGAGAAYRQMPLAGAAVGAMAAELKKETKTEAQAVQGIAGGVAQSVKDQPLKFAANSMEFGPVAGLSGSVADRIKSQHPTIGNDVQGAAKNAAANAAVKVGADVGTIAADPLKNTGKVMQQEANAALNAAQAELKNAKNEADQLAKEKPVIAKVEKAAGYLLAGPIGGDLAGTGIQYGHAQVNKALRFGDWLLNGK